MKNIVITICARGGSKGLKRKNIRTIRDKPLICLTLDFAKRLSKRINAHIGISTEDDEILKIVGQEGFDISYVRPKKLANDNSGKVEVIKHLVDYLQNKNKIEYDIVIDLDVTSPLRKIENIEDALGKLIKDDLALNIFSVSEANRNPYFNIVEKKRNGYFDTVKKGSFLTRQDTPNVYDMNSSFYIYKKLFFTNNIKTTTNRSLIYPVDHICFDIDNINDFDYMCFLLESGKVQFI